MRICDWSSDVCSSDLQNAWTIRNYAGSLVLRLLTTMSAGQTWGSTDIVAQAQDSGRVATAWESVTTVAARSDTPKPLVDAVTTAKAFFSGPLADQIGRASWRERVCQYVEISVVAVSLKTKKEQLQHAE